MAEALLNHWGKGRFQAYSAGSHPTGQVHPLTLRLLARHHLPTGHARSKSWDEFATPDAPPLDFVFTVCDHAARQTCPTWPGRPGRPITAHWGIEDPAAAQGSDAEKMRVFARVFRELEARIRILASLRLDALDQPALRRQLDALPRVVRARERCD